MRWSVLALALTAACARAPRTPTPAPGAGEAVSAASLPDTGGYRGPFNNHDQHHADLCVRLRGTSAALRYPDGTPSGFALTPDLLVPQPGSGVWCPAPGMARLDAREFVIADDGHPMLFHRGGWGFAGQDPGSAVHYGHVLVADLDTVGLRYTRPAAGAQVAFEDRWTPAPLTPWIDEGQRDGNGSPCTRRSERPEHVVVRSIPGDMKYLNSARTATIPYAIYGDPSEDLGPVADRARGIRYTMLEWSWINVRGGGVARAIVQDGSDFFRCTDVPPIRLAAVSDPQTRTHTGWVEAVYGAVRAGGGGLLYGWLVAAHRHGEQPVVAHLDPSAGTRDEPSTVAPPGGPGRPAEAGMAAARIGTAVAADSRVPARRPDPGVAVQQPLTLDLWPVGAPGAPAGAGPGRPIEQPADARGPIARITDVGRPTLSLYRPLPAHRTGAAVLVFPGGGYRHLAIDIEGTEVCRWLTDAGVACALVRYRVPQPNDSTRDRQPLQDAQRAMGLVRLHAASWGIDPQRVGVVGFSAGAHLSAVLSNHYAERSYTPVDTADALSCRPDFAMVIYPAYIAVPGQGATVAPAVRPSSGTPPTFIAQAEDDPVHVENALFYELALKEAGVPAELHVFPRGGHGFGLRARLGEAPAEWPALALKWMQVLGVIPAAP